MTNMHLLKKRILLLIPNLTFGGAQRVFYDQSKLLSDKYELIECVFNSLSLYAFPTGNKILSLDVIAGNNLLDKFYRFCQRIVRLRQIKRQYQIHICISHLEGADLVNVLSKGNEKTIAWVHGSKRHDENISGFLGFIRHHLLIPFTYSKVDKVVTVSEAIRLELIKYYGIGSSRIETVYNYFDLDNILAKSEISFSGSYSPVFTDAPVMIFSGRLAKQKNPIALLSWFKSYIQTNPAKLVIIGDGEMRDELTALCSDLALKTYHPWGSMVLHEEYEVYFLGFQENPFQFIIKATVFILPSLWEGFPMALGEAMCCGVPVASADCPTGPREMLMEQAELGEIITYPNFSEYGLLLPLLIESSYDCWSEGLSRLINDKDLLHKYSVKSVSRSQIFSKQKTSPKVVEVVESLLA